MKENAKDTKDFFFQFLFLVHLISTDDYYLQAFNKLFVTHTLNTHPKAGCF